MKKCIAMLRSRVLTVCTAAAQDVPKIGTYWVTNTFGSIPQPMFRRSVPTAAVPVLITSTAWISGVVDLGAVHNGNIHNSSWTAPPRTSWRPASIGPALVACNALLPGSVRWSLCHDERSIAHRCCPASGWSYRPAPPCAPPRPKSVLP